MKVKVSYETTRKIKVKTAHKTNKTQQGDKV